MSDLGDMIVAGMDLLHQFMWFTIAMMAIGGCVAFWAAVLYLPYRVIRNLRAGRPYDA